jgi:hypothetical protein
MPVNPVSLMHLIPSFLRASALALMISSAAAAEPPTGNYLGTLKLTRNLRTDFPVVTSIRAAATVTQNGQLSIWLLDVPTTHPDGPLAPIRTAIEADGKCVIPKLHPNPPVNPTPVPAPGIPDHFGLPIFFNPIIPEYHGQVNVTGSVFTLSYDDVPDRYTNDKGETVIVNFFVAISPSAEFQFTFRKVSGGTKGSIQAARARR